jgi:hypothetical protein
MNFIVKPQYRRVAPNTYEVRVSGTLYGIVQRDPGASTWSGYDTSGRRVVDRYPGSREVAARNIMHAADAQQG